MLCPARCWLCAGSGAVGGVGRGLAGDVPRARVPHDAAAGVAHQHRALCSRVQGSRTQARSALEGREQARAGVPPAQNPHLQMDAHHARGRVRGDGGEELCTPAIVLFSLSCSDYIFTRMTVDSVLCNN